MTADLTLSVAQVAEQLGISQESVRRAVKRGHLQSWRYGSNVRFSQDWVDAFVRAYTTKRAS